VASKNSAVVRHMMSPTLELENELFTQGHAVVAGVDEVGRGALAGPVTVGIAIITQPVSPIPAGLRDSKDMTRLARENIIAAVHAWVSEYAIGSATAQEIDEVGIVNALRLAWLRAHAQLTVKPSHVILDGKHNWITTPRSDLFSGVGDLGEEPVDVPVTMKVKADAHCGVVAAASVLAKVHRDAYMRQLAGEFPLYDWEGNVGYGAAVHMDAIRKHGTTIYHRRSWNLPEGEE